MGKLSTAWRLLRTNRWLMLLAALDNLGISRKIPDEPYIKMRWRSEVGSKLDLENPKTFNEKIQWLKLYYRRPECTMMQDKVREREYAAARIGEEHIIPLLGVWEDPEKIDFDALPDQFVLKCSHDCGSTIICQDKGQFDRRAAVERLKLKLSRNFYWWAREWAYKDIPPRVIAEKYITDGLDNGGGARDYKFFCFNGKCRLVQVDVSRFVHHERALFDLSWQKLPFQLNYPFYKEQIEKPKNLEEMIAFAELLASEMPFARIDFYEVEGKVWFGEITLYPEAGFGKFSPEEWDRTLGGWLELPDVSQ